MISEVMLNGYTIQGTLGQFEICFFWACMGTVNHAVGMVGIGACSSFKKNHRRPPFNGKSVQSLQII